MAQRVSKSTPASGIYPHHEHRSKRGRKEHKNFENRLGESRSKKDLIEKIKVKELEEEYE